MLLRSPAKINLHLAVGEKQTNGLHGIESIFHAVDRYDYLKVFFLRKGSNRFLVDPNSAIANKTDRYDLEKDHSFFRIFDELRSRWRLPFTGVDVCLQKNIPIGAGLGGGSSNVAAFLLAMGFLKQDLDKNKLGHSADESTNRFISAEKMGNRELKFSQLGRSLQKELIELAPSYGSDVPFFFYGGMAAVSGIGEKIHPIPFTFKNKMLVITPPLHISTGEAYKQNLQKSLAFLIKANTAWFSDVLNKISVIKKMEKVEKSAASVELRLLQKNVFAFLNRGADLLEIFPDYLDGLVGEKLLEKEALLTNGGAINSFWTKTLQRNGSLQKTHELVRSWQQQNNLKIVFCGLSGSGSSLFWVFHDKINAFKDINENAFEDVFEENKENEYSKETVDKNLSEMLLRKKIQFLKNELTPGSILHYGALCEDCVCLIG